MSHLILCVSLVVQALTGLLVQEGSKSPKLLIESTKIEEISFKLRDFDWGKETTDKDSPFVINGSNKSVTIADLESLAEKSVAEIEQQLRSTKSDSKANHFWV